MKWLEKAILSQSTLYLSVGQRMQLGKSVPQREHRIVKEQTDQKMSQGLPPDNQLQLMGSGPYVCHQVQVSNGKIRPTPPLGSARTWRSAHRPPSSFPLSCVINTLDPGDNLARKRKRVCLERWEFIPKTLETKKRMP